METIESLHNMNINTPWKYATIVAVDTETTGQYPLGAELCEMAAVKWQNGKIVDEYQTLIKPTQPMFDEVIAIHHITNEMVANAPTVGEAIGGFYNFINSSVVIAHHAPFDLGFLAIELERFHLPWPVGEVLCSSLLSRQLIPESTNHKLQTLTQFLNIDGGQAHRALDDARVCLKVGLEAFRRCGEDRSIADLVAVQGLPLLWQDYSINSLKENPTYSRIIEALFKKERIVITYDGGSRRGQPRPVFPIGIVRNPNGDFLVANDGIGGQKKRYLMEKIT